MSAPREDRPPLDVRGLDDTLRRVRFEPRASLGPEVLGRLRRGEQSKGAAPLRWRRPTLLLSSGIAALATTLGAAVVVSRQANRTEPAVSMLALGGASSTATFPAETTVDRCCFDLDGGGRADDGIAVRVARGQQAAIREIQVYEDRDGSRSLTDADAVRFVRGPRLIVDNPLPAGLRTRRYCCADYDGGGTRDDGLLVVARPPDRVVLVGLYSPPEATAGHPGLPLH